MNKPFTNDDYHNAIIDANRYLIAFSRESFYDFCRVRMPTIYRKERTYLKTLCDNLQAFYECKLIGENGKPVERCMILMPPRHGKTVTVGLLCQWIFGKNNLASVIDASYNDTLSGRFAKLVRDGIQERKVDDLHIVYSDIFPDTKIKKGDAAYDLWSLEGSHFSFLATSPGASATGMGSNGLIIIDDLIKNAKEAFNESVLEDKWNWYTDTLLSRQEEGCRQIVINTRWCDGDLSGRLIKREADKWHIIKMRANNRCPGTPTNGDMLCPSILSAEKYLERKELTDAMIFSANYDQEPIDTRDRLYTGFKTYTELPIGAKMYNYTDTADEGADYLCSIDYAVKGKLAYIVNVIYTDKAMEETEDQVADMLLRDNISNAEIESNNGGRGFARAVERKIRERGNLTMRISWFHQGENKQSRILTNATGVQNCTVMPEGWNLMWPKFHHALMSLGRASKWTHDDAPDALTGVYEKGILSKKMIGQDIRL